MPLIQKLQKRPPKDTLSVRVDPNVLALIDEYCDFAETRRSDVVQQAVLLTLRRDPEFQEWLLAKGRELPELPVEAKAS